MVVSSPSRRAEGAVKRSVEVYAEPVVLAPDIVLTPEDWDALGLARFEIPGEMPMFGGVLEAGRDLRVRKAHASVSLPGATSTTGHVVAACPMFSREGLVAVTRAYDRFWDDESRSAVATQGRKGKWVVYALDRVLGEGDSVEAALAAANRSPVQTYHRFVLQLPRGEPLRFRLDNFGEPRKATFGTVYGVSGREVKGGSETPYRVLLVTPEDAARLCLEQTEEGRDIVLSGAKRDAGLAAYAFEKPPSGALVLRLLVWEAPGPLWKK